MITYSTLKNRPTAFVAATGLTVAEFNQLLPAFQSAYTEVYPLHLTTKGKERVDCRHPLPELDLLKFLDST